MASKTAHNLRNRKWRSEDIRAEENISFSTLLLSERTLKGLKRAGFRKPSPVQLKAIPLGRCGIDLIVQAKSGTGKTCVFAIVALEGLADIYNLQALILAPTREVAHQICGVINSIGNTIPNLACHAFIGGTSVKDDIQKLKKCQIAVGTPGRIKQLIEMKAMMTGCIRLFVLDEADKLISNNFLEEINWIYNHLPTRKQMLGLSATYPESLMTLLKGYMRNPSIICINCENDLALKGLVQYYCVTEGHPLPHVTYQKKREIIWEIVNKVSFSQCLIFCNTIARVELLCEWLNSQGYPTAKISSSDDQETRLKTIEELKSFNCRILVTSDLTARGIDAENVNFVINADLAGKVETYLHRIGRAGRYGTRATAVTIITTGFEEQKLGEFEKEGNFKVYPLPDPIPENLLSWTVEMVKSADLEESKQPIEELQKLSFSGSSAANNKNGHDSDDGSKSDSSSYVSDDETMGKEKEDSAVPSDKTVPETSSDNGVSCSNLNDSDVETHISVPSASKFSTTEQKNSSVSLHSENQDSPNAAHQGSFESVGSSTVEDSGEQCKVSMCISDVISTSSSTINSDSNTGISGLASSPEDEIFFPCVSDSSTVHEEDIGMVLPSERSIQKTEDNDLKTDTSDLVNTSVDHSLCKVSVYNNSNTVFHDFLKNEAEINENSILDLKEAEGQNLVLSVNESDNIEGSSDIVLLTEKSDTGQYSSCDAIGEDSACTENSQVVCENSKAPDHEGNVLETDHENLGSYVSGLKDNENRYSHIVKNKVVSDDGCSNNDTNKHVNPESTASHNSVSPHSDKCPEVDDSSNISCDNIDKVLLSCCAEENCEGKAFSSLTNLPNSCFDLDKEKFTAYEKTFERIVEYLKTSHGDLEEALSVEKMLSDFKKQVSAEDLSSIQNYLHGSKNEYLSKIREMAALIDTATGSNVEDQYDAGNVEVIDAVHDVEHTSGAVTEKANLEKDMMNQVENPQKEMYVPKPSELNSSNVAAIDEEANEVSEVISETHSHEVKQHSACDEKSENICDVNAVESNFENSKKRKESENFLRLSHAEKASNFISSSNVVDSKLEAASENNIGTSRKTFVSNKSKFIVQTSAKEDILLDHGVKKERRINVHNQELPVKSMGKSKSCRTNQKKHEHDNQKATCSKNLHEDYEKPQQKHIHKQPRDKRMSGERSVSNRKVYERETVNKLAEQGKLKTKKENRHYNFKDPKPAVGDGQEDESMYYQRYPRRLNLSGHERPRYPTLSASNFHTDAPTYSSYMNDNQHCSCVGKKYVTAYAQENECQNYRRCHCFSHTEYDVPRYQYTSYHGNMPVCSYCVNDCDVHYGVHSANHALDCSPCYFDRVECSGHHCCSTVHGRFHAPVTESCCHCSCGCSEDHRSVGSNVSLPNAILNSVYGDGPSLFFCGCSHDIMQKHHEDLLTLISSGKRRAKKYY